MKHSALRCSRVVAAMGVALLLVSPAQAALIAYWDFNDDDLVVDQGAGTVTHNIVNGPIFESNGTLLNALPAVAAGDSLRITDGTNNNGQYIEFHLDLTGYQDLEMTLAQLLDHSKGHDENQVSWSDDGGSSFTDFGATFGSAQGTWQVFAFDFSAVDQLDNNSQAVIRITFGGATGTSTQFDSNIDNVQFTPEPATLALMGLGGLGLVLLRRRK